MNITFTIIFVLISLSLSVAQSERASIIQFEKRHLDLGMVKKGEKVGADFVFTNTSTEEIVIDLVSSCECTEAEWPFRGIKPGEKGKIHFIFDSNKKDTSDTIELDIYLRNLDPKTGNPILEITSYSFELVE